MAGGAHGFRVVRLAERPGLGAACRPQEERIRPQFMFHDRYADRLWHYTCEAFSEFQLYMVDEAGVPVQVDRIMRTRGGYGSSFSPKSMNAP
jgi:hypothetical protein